MGSRIRNWILACVAAVVLFSIGQFVYQFSRTSPCFQDPLLDSGDRCMHLFQDSIKTKIECFRSFGNNTGAECAYKYAEKYRFMVWELGDFTNVGLKQIFIFKQKVIDQINKTANSEFEIGGNPEFLYRDIICYSMAKELDVLINEGNLTIDKQSDTCLIASGALNEIAFADQNKDVQILMKFKVFPAYSILVFLKKNNKFFIIMINSFENKAIPTEALQYLKLE